MFTDFTIVPDEYWYSYYATSTVLSAIIILSLIRQRDMENEKQMQLPRGLRQQAYYSNNPANKNQD